MNLKFNVMKKNMGNADRIIRIIIAAVLLFLFFTDKASGTLGYVALGASIVFLLTSVISFCPLYPLIGINTCPNKKV